MRRQRINAAGPGRFSARLRTRKPDKVSPQAAKVRDAGANILRGGAFKPRTSPYSFQGLGRDGLKILQAAGERFGMPVVTEVMDPRQVEMVERFTDILQVGAPGLGVGA